MADHLRIKIQHLVRNILFVPLLSMALMFNDANAQTANTDMAVPNNSVRAIVVDGNYTYIGGDFTYVGTNAGRGAKATTTSSTIDIRYPKVNEQVLTCIPDGSGGWYIGGSFTRVGTTIRNSIAHINSDGSLDLTWNPNATSGQVYTLLLDGTDLFVGGIFTVIGGQNRRNIAKISTVTGLADVTWDPDPSNAVYCLQLSGSDLFVGGSFFGIGGQSRRNIAKISTVTGLADATWDPNGSGSVKSMLLDGADLFVGGLFSSIGGQSRNGIAKLSTTGTGAADATWDPNASSSVTCMLLSGANLLVGGDFTSIGGQTRGRLAKLSTTGTGAADAIWNPGANNIVNCLLLRGTDLFAGGNFTTIGGKDISFMAKLSTTGTGAVDETWNAGLSAAVLSIANHDNDIYFAGNFSLVKALKRSRLARIDNTTGAVDPNWDPGMSGSVYALAIDGSSIYAGGSFINVNATSTPVVRRYLAKFTTSSPADVDPDWNPNLNNFVSALTISGSSIYAGGNFTTVNGGLTTRNRLAKFPLSGNATTDPDWDPNINNAGFALASDGSFIYAGGSFTTVNGGTTRNRLAKFPLSGSADAEVWDPNMGGQVNALAITGSSIYAGGNFFTVNGSKSRNGIATFDNVTGTADSWNANANGAVFSLVVSNTDVYAGGFFSMMGGNLQPYLALFTDRALPVELVSFSASVTKGVVNLNWHTATEVDNYGFEVQRATAGSDDWKKIGFIQGHHTTNSPKYYSFTDQPSTEDAYKYKYRLKQLDNSGSHEFSNIIEVSLGTPANFLLEQNYPNPFNPATVIRYQLPVAGMVSIDLYNTAGEKVASLLNKAEDAGVHSLSFDAVKYGLSSGIYFYRMTVVPAAGQVFSTVKKLSLIK